MQGDKSPHHVFSHREKSRYLFFLALKLTDERSADTCYSTIFTFILRTTFTATVRSYFLSWHWYTFPNVPVPSSVWTTSDYEIKLFQNEITLFNLNILATFITMIVIAVHDSMGEKVLTSKPKMFHKVGNLNYSYLVNSIIRSASHLPTRTSPLCDSRCPTLSSTKVLEDDAEVERECE